MTGFKIVNLKMLIDEVGEEKTKALLSEFSCPLNKDVESFLKNKAIEFSKQGLSQTHLVYASYQGKTVLVGYFCLANKYITIMKDKLSKQLCKRIAKFGIYDQNLKSYCISAPLIAQLGKNFANGYNHLISGDELLKLACDTVANIQRALGGKIVYLECEDDIHLTEFYSANGFCEFDKRPLDRDETDLKGDYLIQMLKYLS